MKAGTSIAALAAGAALAVPAAVPAAALKHAPLPHTVSLPGERGEAAAASLNAEPRTWIVGTRTGGAAVARAHGARRIAGRAWRTPRGRARALAAALRERGLLEYAEPNRLSRRTQAPAPDPLSAFAGWRDFVVGDQVAPLVTPESPLIGVVDTQIDLSHPEIAGSNITSTSTGEPSDFHGTATATVAAAPKNDIGFLGLWPGARALNASLPSGGSISCSASARGIASAIEAGAAVINMSYGSTSRCITEEHQVMRAVEAGAVPVAASGNEFAQGNPYEFPASLPHVITVGATDQDDDPTSFSNENGAVDLSAPGTDILTGVPARFDPDGDGDGFAVLEGTSFAAPMVSAAVAWVRAARPELTPFQAAQVVRLGARDVGKRGYDDATGFGVLHMPGALSRRPPADDPLEPNDDIRYVDGRAFGDAAARVYSGRPAAIAATADYAEDPVDVYRVRIPAGRRVRVTLKPSVGDPDLFLFGRRARSVRAGRALRSSVKRGKATERITVRSRGRRARPVYVAVGFHAKKKLKLLNASYVLRAR